MEFETTLLLDDGSQNRSSLQLQMRVLLVEDQTVKVFAILRRSYSLNR